MNITETATFQKALKTLQALQVHGIKFRIIAGDESFGDLETVTKSKFKRRVGSREYGSITASFRSKLQGMSEGDVVSLVKPSLPDLTASQYSSCISAWCTTHWGKGNYLLSRDNDQIEVLRVH